jgi:hypothetical protein
MSKTVSGEENHDGWPYKKLEHWTPMTYRNRFNHVLVRKADSIATQVEEKIKREFGDIIEFKIRIESDDALKSVPKTSLANPEKIENKNFSICRIYKCAKLNCPTQRQQRY